ATETVPSPALAAAPLRQTLGLLNLYGCWLLRFDLRLRDVDGEYPVLRLGADRGLIDRICVPRPWPLRSERTSTANSAALLSGSAQARTTPTISSAPAASRPTARKAMSRS